MDTFWGSSGGFLNDQEDEEGEGGEDSSYVSGRDGLILLIDATKGMFVGPSTEDFHFSACVKCARNVLMNKIISSERDLISVIFYGTAKSKNASDFPGIYVLQDLDMPDANRILELESYAKEETAMKIGQSNEFSFADCLWACSNLFATSSHKIASKRVIIFTNNDDPHHGKNELKRRAVRKAKDLADLRITIDLIHLRPKEGKFEISKFFQDIVSFDDDDDTSFADPVDKFEEMMSRVRFKQTKKRSTGRLAMHLGEGLKFAVSLFTTCRAATKGSYVNVYRKTNEEVKTVTKQICDDTGQELIPTDIKYYQEFGGSKVVFEKEEIDSMRNLKEQGIHLLGFKPRKVLKHYYHVKTSPFMYPDEKTMPGSTALFAALLQRCIAREVIPICVFVPRRASAPRLAALLPQDEELDEYRMQIRPPGFYVITLPFSDDIRKLKFDEPVRASDSEIDKAKAIIEKLKFTFDSEKFENPALQKFFRNLEALALDRDEVEEVRDLTIPNYEKMEEKAGKEIEAFKAAVFSPGYDPETSTAGGKRKTPAEGGGAAKKVKTEDVDVEVMARTKQLQKLTVPVLKSFCQYQKLKPSSQKKADLITAIYSHYGI